MGKLKMENFLTMVFIKGKKTLSNESYWKEILMEGQLTGQGKKSYPDGRAEEGEFKDGQLNGQGIMTYPDGREEGGKLPIRKLKWQRQKDFSSRKNRRGIFQR